MTSIEVYKGDTVQLNLHITNDGQPFIPTKEKIVFSVGRVGSPVFSIEAKDGVVLISHDQTESLRSGKYMFDVRVYDEAKNLVATPIFGEFHVLEVVNLDLL